MGVYAYVRPSIDPKVEAPEAQREAIRGLLWWSRLRHGRDLHRDAQGR